ncbi:SbcC/MukB-like Walker B domain-containing protein [Microbacterium sp. KSW2-21]|uniref:SbcC/MukB-like Walker B domain-containing protein n=3 Tax=Microbacteriaceae TaxID=85023 RepID=A0ABU3RZR8_9MICO|nr:SbcC/MukB-like Walker B domain-containing protein [Microbacterium sp. KSW2-21]MDU0328378.1 SbcC/MukB-like Walker B domain-containing protein [Microbacterium sp. KSW2-21]
MTMLETLFGLIPAASRGQQWVAEDLQLINWGGYDGTHRVRFAPTATLLCGGSGSGKSTLMDAYVALMMPHTTPFNGASNGAVVGRPRGQEQRNILSYGRGKLDESRTDEGTKVRVLRGDGVDTWTAIGMTWADHDGARFTAVRAWYFPAAARTLDDAVKVRATVHGAFDLRQLERAAQSHLSDSAVRATGLDTLATDREFSARLHTVLGIGAAGAGAKAMSLLARIQAGQQITTVDDLYKRMVLEEPETLSVADAVVTHFDGLESTRTRMLEARQQVRALQPIRGMKTRIDDAAERLRLIDALGRFGDPESRASLWRAQRRVDLLEAVEAELRDRTHATDALVRERQALADAAEAEAEREGLGDVLRAAGGDRLDAAQRELRTLERRLAGMQRDRERFEAALAVLSVEATTEKQFAALVAEARRTLADTDAKSAVRDAFVAASSRHTDLRQQLAALEAEHRRTQTRDDNIPPRLHEAREALAAAAGLTAAELPFVAELVDVRTEFEPWRGAFTLALGGFATTLLVDAAHLASFRSAIDGVRLGERLRFEGVPTDLPERGALDPATLPGRLEFRSSPFTGWLQDRLEQQFSFVCVDAASELSQHRMALTISGQTSQGARGAHGGSARQSILGFSSRVRLTELGEQIVTVRRDLTSAKAAVDEAAAALDAFDDRRGALEKIADLSWDQVDVASVERDLDRWNETVVEVTAGNPRIAELQEQISGAKARVARLREEIGGAKTEQQALAARWAEITDDVDAAQILLERAEDREMTLTDDEVAYLDGLFVAPSGEDVSPSQRLARFDAALESASKRLLEEQRAAQETWSDQRESLRRTMTAFTDRWPSPNLLADPDEALGDFERILSELEASGLHELEAEWRDSLLRLSGNDLTSLDSALTRALREIRERIAPINDIMQDLPFYDDEHRLQIVPRESQSEVRKRFRRELRDVRAAIDAASSDEEREAVYGRMARLINRIRPTAPDFADLVDVRNHVRVSAERFRADTGEHVALYDHIGEKSGGESQELIAFIVGAALRYQLGDAGSERPRYAPVFLDEALIKADAHFTKRAIGAWRGLGFQLVIGAPNDKYSAIEPHVDVEYDILKDTRGRSWAKAKVALPA